MNLSYLFKQVISNKTIPHLHHDYFTLLGKEVWSLHLSERKLI